MVRAGFACLEPDFGTRPAAALGLGEDGLEDTRCDVTIPAALGETEAIRVLVGGFDGKGDGERGV